MNDIHSGTGSASHENTATLSMADWLCRAAAPTFALMALLTCVFSGDAAMLCMGSSPLTGMAGMYLLMSAFHLAPWLRVISGRQARQ